MILVEKHKSVLTFFLVILLWSCGGGGDDPAPVDDTNDREVILTHWADNIIIPGYANLDTKMTVMFNKADLFMISPSTTSLTEFRNAWVDAYTEWQKVEQFEFGPADRYTIRNFFNIYPADVAGITANINDPSSSLEVPASYARQGFPALDYLINGVGSDDAAIVAYYTTGPDAAKRLAYIDRVWRRMNELLTNVRNDWNGGYRETFISNTGLDIGSSMGAVVNAYVLYYERYIRSGKIGIPAGMLGATSGAPNPDKVEGYYKRDLSRTFAKTAHQATMDFFNGKNANGSGEGPSFKSYLDGLGAKDPSSGTSLSTIINNQFSAINAKIDQLSPNFYQQIQTNNQAMIDTYNSLQTNVRYLKVDMTSAMSITITYTDNDGD